MARHGHLTAVGAALAVVCGVAAACVLLVVTGFGKPAGETELLGFTQQHVSSQQLAAQIPRRTQQLGPRAASYVRRWSEQAEAAAMSPKEQLLALKAQGVPVIFPAKVTDKSGNLQKMVRMGLCAV